MPPVKIWLLDINDEVIDGKPEIRLWGLDDKGRRTLIIDRSFLPYFYLLLEDDAIPEKVLKEIDVRKTSTPGIVALHVVDKKYFGKPVRVIRVACRNPTLVTKYASSLGRVSGVRDHLEDDIRYSSRYLIDKGINPCGWHKVEVEEVENEVDAEVEKVYLAKSTPRVVDSAETPRLRVLAFSMVCHSARGSPKPEKDPIIIISSVANDGSQQQFIAEDHDDRHVIESFIKHVQDFDPDIIVGYGSNKQDWPYLIERAKRLGIKLLVDRSGSEPHTSLYGHVSVTGRSNIDLADYAEEIREVKVKTLENIADYLGVTKKEKRTKIEEIDLSSFWEDEEKRPALQRYAMENSQSILGISNITLDFAMQLSNLIGLPLDHVGAAAVGFRVEWYLIRRAHEIGELVPKRTEKPYFPYKGATVLKPKPGIHEKVVVLDFSSMYPNIMIANNISPDTYVKPHEPEPLGGVNTAPEVKHKFRKEPPGFYKQVLSDLIKARNEIKAKLKRLSPESPQHKVLNARELAVKTVANASYGYAGWVGARWYIRPVAEATTAWGRHAIEHTVDLAKKSGLNVIYGDTDSVFVEYKAEEIKKFLEAVKEEVGLEIKPDKVYEPVLFTEAKKRYAGLLPDGRLDIVGLEVARGDWTESAKKVQEGVIEIILKERSADDAVKFVHQYIKNLKSKKVPYSDLIIWKTLTKPIEEYKVNAPHVTAAKTLKRLGWALVPGEKIGYVIEAGGGKLYERAAPYSLTTYDQLDLKYYEENQIIPAALRILSIFGKNKEDLKPEDAVQRTL